MNDISPVTIIEGNKVLGIFKGAKNNTTLNLSISISKDADKKRMGNEFDNFISKIRKQLFE